ncbi:hypothetical protein FHS36_002696 [Streptomyces eurocidicus]|uniref:SCO6045-like C-terminal domain-containing protein n=1 Tax=Streptomyces eurocidicus TaxID=66423 RepID=A0A7W8BCD0_STREU|nr:hypothetical protein [Streptomyces eurocidicus]
MSDVREAPGGPGPGAEEAVGNAKAPESTEAAAETGEAGELDAARKRLARAQLALLSTLVAGGPAPDGFDPGRLEAQRRALLDKRAHVIAKVAPELRDALGSRFHELFLGYARGRQMAGGHHRDALGFARELLRTGALEADPERHRRLADWVARRTARTSPSRSTGRPPLHRRLAAALRARRAERPRKGN